ncbi:MAG: hypothetical protein ABW201_13525 [Candidatus Thiodiazotropha sp.]
MERLIVTLLKQSLLPVMLVGIAACGGGSGGGGDSDTLFPAGDADGDGLTNQAESELGTDPRVADSDGDRIWDLTEVLLFDTMPSWQTDPTKNDELIYSASRLF